MASSTAGRGFGGVVSEPRDEQAVMDPRVTKTMSCGSMWISPVAPVLLAAVWISDTVMAEPGAKERVFTLVSSYFCQ